MLPNLNPTESRIIGCLIEKSVITPDQYPLTLNALTNACNQKSARDPVMSLDPGLVQRTARELRDKHLVQIEDGQRAGVEKYRQRLCNTTFSELQLDPDQLAIICLLLLRGPQTPGELRAHSGRLHSFPDNAAVERTLAGMLDWPDAPLVIQLPRSPGRRDSEYMHLLSGPVDIEAYATETRSESPVTGRTNVAELAERVSRLEAELEALKAQIKRQID